MTEFDVATRMQRHDLHKLHGLGNDFLVWFRPAVPDNAAVLAEQWCNRSTGIGADGLIIALGDRKAPQFVLFNADGGRAEVSGNGLRCFAHAVARRNGLDELDVDVQTDIGSKHIRIVDALSETATASVEMGQIAAGPPADDLDLASIDARQVDTVDIGNPHVVIHVDDPGVYDMAVVGPAIEAHFMPIGINVHLVAPTKTGMKMAIWERGAGVTEACGSGACAVAAVAHRTRSDMTTFEIDMPGGAAAVTVADGLTLHGPSTYVAAIDVAVTHG